MSSSCAGCVSKCWDNSKYVTDCGNDDACLCEDPSFQSVGLNCPTHKYCIRLMFFQVVLQCLYSQCQTTVFGSALHHTLLACPSSALDIFDTLPPLIRHQGLRKRSGVLRMYNAGGQSASASASTIHKLARRSAAGSAIASALPTRNVPNLSSRSSLAVTSYSAPFITTTSSPRPATLLRS